MQFFDVLVHPSERVLDDLGNLAYFGTTHVCIALSADARHETSQGLIAAWQTLLDVHLPAVRATGVEAGVALGMPPSARPRRTHEEVWGWLEAALEDPRVWAIGELALGDGPADTASLRRLLALGRASELPLMVNLRGAATIPEADHLLALAAEAEFPSRRLVVRGADYTSFRRLLDARAAVCLEIGPRGADPATAADMIVRYGDRAARSVILTHGAGRATNDVLGGPKTVRALRERGLDEAVIRQITFQNAAQRFERAGASAA